MLFYLIFNILIIWLVLCFIFDAKQRYSRQER